MPDCHEARLQNYEKRLETQELERHNEGRTLGSQPLGYLPEAQALSTRPTQPPQSIRADSPSSEASETHLQYTIEVSQTDIAAIIGYTCLLFQFSNGSSSSSEEPLQSPSLNIKGEYPHAQTVGDIFAEADTFAFPEVRVLLELVNLFFIHINAWCPVLHQKTILGIVNTPSRLRDEGDQILLHSIVATTLRFYTGPFFTNKMKAKQKERSNKEVLLYGLENPTVRSLQAMAIITLDRVGSTNGPSAWMLLAVVARSVVLLELVDEFTCQTSLSDKPSISITKGVILSRPQDWIEEESRRRLFWMVFLLDRLATIVTAHDFALDDKAIKRRLPCHNDHFANNNRVVTRSFKRSKNLQEPPSHDPNTDAFALYFEVLEILSRVHKFLRRTPMDISASESVRVWETEYDKINRYLASWWARLPSMYVSISSVESRDGEEYASSSHHQICGWVMLHATYHA